MIICFFCLNFVAFLKLKLLFYYLIHKKMKKFVLSLAVLAGLSFVACQSENKAENEEATVEEAAAVVEEAVEAEDDTATVEAVEVVEGDSVKA